LRLIIAGSRDIKVSIAFIEDLINMFELCLVEKVVSGKCRGIDFSGESWAIYNQIKVLPFPYLKTAGKAGGPIRNKAMAECGDALLLIWNGKSKGSASMKREMEKLKKPIYEVILNGIPK